MWFATRRPSLDDLSDDQIRPAAFQKLMRDAIADLASQRSGQASTLKLGSNDADLVFQPTAPCRIVDTRNASPVSGTIAAGTHRDFYGYATGGTYDWGTNQGGTPGQASASCPDTIVPCVSGTLCVSRVKAMLATVTVVSPTAAGNLIAWTGSGTAPTTSILNFSTGDVLANTTVIPIASSRDVIVPVTTKDFAIAYNGPTGQANVVVDVHGYFTASNQTALSCTREDATGGTTIANNTRYTLNAPSCTSPDREMTTYCWYLGAAPLGVAVVENAPGYCVFLNASGGSISGTNFRASSNCCHIPGLAP